MPSDQPTVASEAQEHPHVERDPDAVEAREHWHVGRLQQIRQPEGARRAGCPDRELLKQVGTHQHTVEYEHDGACQLQHREPDEHAHAAIDHGGIGGEESSQPRHRCREKQREPKTGQDS